MVIFACMVFAIAISFYYNKNFKSIQYNYSIKFNTLSSWDVNKLGYSDYTKIEGLVRNHILDYLATYGPLLRYGIENNNQEFILNFKLNKKINTDNFFEKVSSDLKNNIITSLENQFETFLNEAKYLKINVENQLDYLKQKKKYLDDYAENFAKEKNSNTYSPQYLEFQEEYKITKLNIIELEYALMDFEIASKNDEAILDGL